MKNRYGNNSLLLDYAEETYISLCRSEIGKYISEGDTSFGAMDGGGGMW